MVETESLQQIWVRLPPPLVQKIDLMAESEKRSRANLLSILVEEAVIQREQAQQPAPREHQGPLVSKKGAK